MTYNPRSRMSAMRAMEHPYISRPPHTTHQPMPPATLDWDLLCSGGGGLGGKGRGKRPHDQLSEGDDGEADGADPGRGNFNPACNGAADLRGGRGVRGREDTEGAATEGDGVGNENKDGEINV